ncbi:B12-binding domain-containing radical SAM protein [Natranaerofaba carboxydovora]|uniref:B12-binding domain-containing radical SAM protein n=1 Tax=Natranaerofaba carboxydovora TaxID=2742683 RepID=UPI001F140019|nr:radical SAM protein [Natranaerofaba carboxydovora]UMZ72601.1 Hopanoid C-3 methylase [Natranaerofaba carboxydovora]
MKITLIEPKSPGVHVYSRVMLPRLGLPLIGTILRDLGHDVKLFVEEIEQVDMERVKESDLIGFSSTTSTAPRAYRWCDEIKSINPEIPIVIGGAHVSFLVEEALEHADYCVMGEGEAPIQQLVKALENNEKPVDIPGLAYKDEKGEIHKPDRAAFAEVNNFPHPDLNLIEGSEKMSIKPVIGSRGCPYGCNFCSVIQMFGRKYRFCDIDGVIDQLENTSARHVFFYDDNFAANVERTKEMLREMIRRQIKVSWSAQVRVDIAKDPELLDLMRDAGASMVYIGFESVNPETLKEYKKGLEIEQTIEGIKAIRERGIMIHGMFVIGGDNDDINSPKKTVDFALEHKIDTIQLLTLTPLPGTPFFEQLKEQNRLINTDWEYYDGHHVVHMPAKMTPYELQVQLMKQMARFYSLKRCMQVACRLNLIRLFFRFYGFRTVKRWISDKTSQDYVQYLKESYST